MMIYKNCSDMENINFDVEFDVDSIPCCECVFYDDEQFCSHCIKFNNK